MTEDVHVQLPGSSLRIRVPAGWTHAMSGATVLLGHEEIAGLIVVMSHASTTEEEVRGTLAQGYADGGLWLEPATEVTARGEHCLVSASRGLAGGEPARAHVVTTFGPPGGIAVLAISTPVAFSDRLVDAADRIAASLEPIVVAEPSAPADPSAPAAPSAPTGVWGATESQLSGSPESAYFFTISQWVTLRPDGTVAWHKAEGSAGSYDDLTHEVFEHYRSGRVTTGSAGRYRVSGSQIVIEWSGQWAGLVSTGSIDPTTGTMMLSNMGILESGATLRFTRYPG